MPPRTRSSPLPRDFYTRDPRVVAPALLGKVLLAADGRAGRIVETEAYCGAEDPAAHTYSGPTPRNATMFGPPGHLYVYFSYGMHWCANTVCGGIGEGWGVLLRALEPLKGIERMRQSRPSAVRDTQLCSGPARLAQALGITGANDGADLVLGDQGYRIVDDGLALQEDIIAGPRIGISRAVEQPWRWHLAGNRHVSRPSHAVGLQARGSAGGSR